MKNEEQSAAMAIRVRSFHTSDQHEPLRDSMLRWIEDPLRPKTDKGRRRINPILILLALIALLAGSTFLFFSLVQS